MTARDAAVEARKGDVFAALFAFYWLPRWRLIARRRAWRYVEKLTYDLDRLTTARHP